LHFASNINRILQAIQSTLVRSLATTALKASPPSQKEKIKYFKIYRWDPEQDQKPYLVRHVMFVMMSIVSLTQSYHT
jgi:hypothetical protein